MQNCLKNDSQDNVIDSHFSSAVVCGTGINAHTIIRNLQRLGLAESLILLRDASESPGFVGAINTGVVTWAVDIAVPEDLPALIEEKVAGNGQIAVFFTDERYHFAFKVWLATNPNSRLRCFLGSTIHTSVILDRYQFCRFIEERELAPVPSTIMSTKDPFHAFGNEFIVRPRRSWYGVAQRERIAHVCGEEQFRQALADYSSRGLTVADLCYQELLSIRNEDNVSVCGWYGSATRHLYCSRKVLQYPPGVGGGDLVELIRAPEGVMTQAEAILDALAYEGPFELEFVFDKQAQVFKVIELNPRFWLQHGLIEALSGCALVSTYLGRQPLPRTKAESGLRFWVNPLYSLYRTVKLDFRSLRCWASHFSWAPFSLGETLRYAGHYVAAKFRH